jgi:NADPH2:quinone reductase
VQAWRVHRHGAPRDALVLESIDAPAPGPGELRIAVEAATLNFNDVDGIRGRYRTVAPPLPYIPGMEVLGRVDACGEGAAPSWIGQRVVATPSGAFGGYAALAVAPAAMTFAMPDDLDTETAAAIFFPFHLSWLGLVERGRLRAGDTVLVHAAAGGVGSAAVQIARSRGARVIATAGSTEKLELCRSLGAEVAIDYRNGFFDAVMAVTHERGVDVAFDTVGGDVTLETFRCMAFGGRHLAVGFSGGIEAEDEGMVPRPIVFGSFDFCGVILAYVDDPLAVKRRSGFNLPSRELGESIHASVLELVSSGSVRPVVGRTVAFSDLPDALAAMEARQTVGRVVVHLPR